MMGNGSLLEQCQAECFVIERDGVNVSWRGPGPDDQMMKHWYHEGRRQRGRYTRLEGEMRGNGGGSIISVKRTFENVSGFNGGVGSGTVGVRRGEPWGVSWGAAWNEEARAHTPSATTICGTAHMPQGLCLCLEIPGCLQAGKPGACLASCHMPCTGRSTANLPA